MLTIEEADAAIQKGIKWLDENPRQLDEIKNWREKIKIGQLNLASVRDCVFGQLFGDYVDGLTTIFETELNYWTVPDQVHYWAMEHGFQREFCSVIGFEIREDELRLLTQRWVVALSA